MRKIDEIIVHCSATKPGHKIGADTIRKWHTAPKPKGNGWSDIGYHFVIRRTGQVEEGRPLSRTGAHCKGRNKHSIGICMVGGVDQNGEPESNFTGRQYTALTNLMGDLIDQFGDLKISGHRDYSDKACPSFNVQAFMA